MADTKGGPTTIQDIESHADYYPPSTYGLGANSNGEDGGLPSLLTFYSSLSLESDAATEQFIPISSVPQRSRNTKLFAVGIIPPVQNITGRLLDRTASAPSQEYPTEEQLVRLAEPLSPASAAEAELLRWTSETEGTAVGRQIVDEYWKSTGVPTPDPTTVPWSGAFINYVANKGAPGSLGPSGSHSIYSAIAKSGGRGRYRALRPEDAGPVQVNDIIVQGRDGTEPTFDDLNGNHFDSHGDIITRIEGGNVRAIGGNVDDKVAAKTFHTNPDGTLDQSRFFVILRYQGDLPTLQARQVEPDAASNTTWVDQGSQSAGDARDQISSLSQTKLHLDWIEAQAKTIKATQMALQQMANTPPLRFLVNPNKFAVKAQKIVSDGSWTRKGPIIEFWGDDQDKISGSGQVAAFYAIDKQPPHPRGAGPGITRTARNASQAYQNFQALWLLYKNNGVLHMSENLTQSDRDFVLSTVGSVYIYYDNILYIGSFDSFNVTEEDTKPFTLSYDFEFTVRAAFLLDRPDDFDYYGKEPELKLARTQTTSLPTRSNRRRESDILSDPSVKASQVSLANATSGQEVLAAQEQAVSSIEEAR